MQQPKQTEVQVVCKICKAKYILINTMFNAVPYICLKCTPIPILTNKNK